MKINGNAIKPGNVIQHEGGLWVAVKAEHVKPGKGGAFVRTKLRNMKTGAVAEKTFNAGVKVGLARVERKEMQFLFREGDSVVFMDLESYDQLSVPAEVIGGAAAYLSDGASASVATHEGTPISVELPASVSLAVTATDPGVKGDRVSGALKPATLETGIVVQVPLFVEEGDRLKIDTRSGEYIERVK